MDTSNKTLFGILAYLGPLVIVSYAMANGDSFVKFHVRQGLVLLLIEVVLWVLSAMFWFLWPLYSLLNLVIIIFAILGIINVVNMKESKLPVVGDWADKFNV